MSESDQKKELGAVARSIDALFADDAPEAAEAAESPDATESTEAEEATDTPAPVELEEPVAVSEETPREAVAADAPAAEEETDTTVHAEPVEAPEPEAAAEPISSLEDSDIPTEPAAAEPISSLEDSDVPTEPAAAEPISSLEDSDIPKEPAAAEPISSLEDSDIPTEPAAAEPDEPGSDAEVLLGEEGDDLDEPPAQDVTWEVVAEEEPRPPAATGTPDRADFLAAVDHFLASPVLDRGGQALELRSMITGLREANALDPLADAVERIILAGGDEPDEASLAIADSMVSAGVASRIVARLGMERDEVRRVELMVVAKEIGLEMAIALSDALSDTTDSYARRTFMDAMIQLGPTAMVVLEQMVEDRSWFVVRNAVAILGEVGGERAVELVTSTLAHTDARVRREALLALAKVGGEDAGLLVFGMLEDPDVKVRLAAIMAAGALKVERALKPLLTLLDLESDPEITEGALRALGQIGDPGAVQAIEKFAIATFLKRHPTDIRIVAYRALHNIGTPHASKTVAEAVNDKDPEVQQAVRAMLGDD